MEKHILFFDIDGTILFHNRVPLAVKRAIRKARKEGHLCVINTGRPRSNLPKQVEKMSWDGFICAGSYVEFGQEVLESRLMERKSVEKIMEYVVRDRIPTVFDCIGPSYSLYFNGWAKKLSSPEELFERFDELKINKLEILRPLSEEVLRDIAPYASCYPMGSYVDIFVLGSSKATGMERIGRETNVPRERMIAFGDNNNDLDMLRFAGKSVAMKKSSPDAIKNATYHATSRRHGVCQGIKKYLNTKGE